MLQRMALLASGRYDVWGFSWADVESAGKGAAPGFDVFLRDRERFEQILAAPQAGGRPLLDGRLRRVLDGDSLAWFAAVMAGEISEAEWGKLAFLALFSQLEKLNREVVPEVVREVDAWIPEGARPAFSAPPRTDLVFRWPADLDERLISIVVMASESSIRDDFASLPTGGPFASLAVAARLHDANEVDDKRMRQSWQALLRLAILLRTTPNAWLTCDLSAAELDFGPVLLLRQITGGATLSPWDKIQREVVPAFVALTRLLAGADVKIPEVGLDLPDENDGSCGIVAELAWPDRKIAVVTQEERGRAETPVARDWQVFVKEEISEEAGELLAALGGSSTLRSQG
jgi:hypothetical protein